MALDSEDDQQAVSAQHRPRPPWHPFPLLELSILLALVLVVLGVALRRNANANTLLLCGVTFGAAGGLATVIHEHFSGYRRHSALLAAACAVTTVSTLSCVQANRAILGATGATIFATAYACLQKATQKPKP